MPSVKKCLCGHTYKMHSMKNRSGPPGCQLCDCQKIVRRYAGRDILVDAPQ